MKQLKRLTLCGSFGWGHARDAAVAAAIADLGKEIGFDLQISLLAGRDAPFDKTVIGLGKPDAKRLQALQGQPILVTGHGVIEPSSHSVIRRGAPLY